MSEPVLLESRDEGIVTLTLNRPKAMNALSQELRRAITSAFERLQDDAEVKAVILTGAGRAFCAGLDLKELGQQGAPGGVGEGVNLIGAMNRFDRPILGAINGVAITGGFEVAIACDILIGSTEARFADTHARVGILPGWGLSQKLSRLVGIHRAKQLSLTGNFLGAEEARAWGLLGQVVAPDALLDTAHSLARDILSCDAETIRGYKALIDDGFATTYRDGIRAETERSVAHAKQVSAEQIAERRAGIQERGRSQSRD